MSGVGALYSTPVWSLSPADLLFLSVGPVGWTLGFCLYTFEARRREGWKQWLWPGVWPVPFWGGGRTPCLLCLGGAPLREWAFCGLSTNTSHPWQVWTNPGSITWAVDPSPWCLSTCPMPGPALVPGPQALALTGLWGKPCTFRTRNVRTLSTRLWLPICCLFLDNLFLFLPRNILT